MDAGLWREGGWRSGQTSEAVLSEGCPGAKKREFLTSVLDALSTDMVHAVSDPSSPGRLSEPDPSHTLEERVVHWYFKLLDKNNSGDIGKKEIKPFKRFLRKKSKPKKCVKKFVEYCDVNNDKSISLQELMGCLGATREEVKADTRKRHRKKSRWSVAGCQKNSKAGIYDEQEKEVIAFVLPIKSFGEIVFCVETTENCLEWPIKISCIFQVSGFGSGMLTVGPGLWLAVSRGGTCATEPTTFMTNTVPYTIL
ncbi:hypothetical protein E5288_WYG017877 [Bos mutus]|uniref:EF-hand domain-containing protein n=1 Tax=Bos mutus TaxID=72004 RepID=A0A6B0S4Y5_9CETA|nr:hypothetical protein [Bos mutus]